MPPVGFGETCDTTNVCRVGECLEGTCRCIEEESYNDLLNRCIPAGYKVVTEPCTHDSDCYPRDETGNQFSWEEKQTTPASMKISQTKSWLSILSCTGCGIKDEG